MGLFCHINRSLLPYEQVSFVSPSILRIGFRPLCVFTENDRTAALKKCRLDEEEALVPTEGGADREEGGRRGAGGGQRRGRAHDPTPGAGGGGCRSDGDDAGDGGGGGGDGSSEKGAYLMRVLGQKDGEHEVAYCRMRAALVRRCFCVE